jgi:hypothetical protein
LHFFLNATKSNFHLMGLLWKLLIKNKIKLRL